MAVEPEPSTAGEIFGGSIGAARDYVGLLSTAGMERGLMGPREAGRLWTRHVLNSAAIVDLVPANARLVDIGAGAGLPGIPIALARPDLRVDLVESLLRRTTFLSEAVAMLGLSERVRVVRRRAEEAVYEVGGADAVTARAVAPLHKLARWSGPLLRPGGLLLAIKGESAADELARDREALHRARFRDAETCTVGHGNMATTVVRARRQ